MKKLIALLLALVMVLSLAACGNDKESKDDGKLNGNPSAPVEGTLSGRSYVNEYFGFRVDLDSDWSVYDAETTAQIMGTALENLDLGITLERTGMITPFYASYSDSTTTINLAIEDTTITAGGVLSESAYAKAGAAQLKLGLESMGCTDVTTKIETIDFAGSDHTCIKTQATIYGMTMYETQVLLSKGNYMGILTTCSYLEDTTGDLVALFKKA